MKPSFKTTTLIATIGMAIYTYYALVNSVPAMIWLYINNLHGPIRDFFYATWMYLLLGVMIITLIAMIRVESAPSAIPTTSFRIMTYILTIVSILAMMGGSLPLPVHASGEPFMYVPIPWRIIVLILATIWLWMLSRQSSIGPMSRALRIAMMIGIWLLALPILLQIISATSYWLIGELLYLHSWFIYSWIRIFVPTTLLCWYSIELFKENFSQSCIK